MTPKRTFKVERFSAVRMYHDLNKPLYTLEPPSQATLFLTVTPRTPRSLPILPPVVSEESRYKLSPQRFLGFVAIC